MLFLVELPDFTVDLIDSKTFDSNNTVSVGKNQPWQRFNAPGETDLLQVIRLSFPEPNGSATTILAFLGSEFANTRLRPVR